MVDIDNKEFEERADYIKDEDLLSWTVDNNYFENIQHKIIQQGAKLFVGPRGVGKTHQFRHAFLKCQRDKNYPLAIYISFGKYYHLEPLLYNSANAIRVFNSWILAKIILECYNLSITLNLDKLPTSFDLFIKEDLEEFIEKAERNIELDDSEYVLREISIQKAIIVIEGLMISLNRKRCLLLLDDAALTLTPEYMIEFFDIFRSLKTTHISPKASVYPGTTEYGPRFHIGQDAEEVQVWLDVEKEEYSEFMDSIIEKRFKDINENASIIELFKYASFGVPRAFISLIRSFQQDNGKTLQQKFNNVISTQRIILSKEYHSLSLKLPQYLSIIETGNIFFEKIIQLLVDANQANPNIEEKKTYFGISKDNDFKQANRMLKFLIEAGLLFKLSPINAGNSAREEYERYMPHYLFLIDSRAFDYSKGFNPQEVVKVLKRKPDRRSLRRKLSSVLSEEQINNLKLDLPACTKCGTKRLTEKQKFCHNCGAPLVGKSAYKTILKTELKYLPISQRLIDRIYAQTHLKTVEDLLMSQTPGSDLKQVKYIGDIRSTQIMNIIKTSLDEFLG